MMSDSEPNPYEGYDTLERGRGWSKKRTSSRDSEEVSLRSHGTSREYPSLRRKASEEYISNNRLPPVNATNEQRAKRPSLTRTVSRNAFNVDSEILVVKKRLGADAPKQLLNKTFPRETIKRIDYVLVLKNKDPDDEDKKSGKKDDARLSFEAAMLAQGVEIQKEVADEFTYVKLHFPFWRLCKEAQSLSVEMPLIGCELYDDDDNRCCGCMKCWGKCTEKYFETDNEVDFVSAPFVMDKIHVFVNHDNPDVFFRPALRSYLAHNILIQIDIRDKKSSEVDDEPMAKKGLPYLLMKKVYHDAFILHDESFEDPMEKEELAQKRAEYGSQVEIRQGDMTDKTISTLLPDTRIELNNTWPKLMKFQPMWKIRNYFGEKIALYFAWTGTMVWTLVFPTLLGLVCFFYGLYLSIAKYEPPAKSDNATLVEEAQQVLEESLGVIKSSFDNEITPFSALLICIWGTVFLEIWKRKCATLAYEWDVDNFEETELDRPEFVGTHIKPDPIIIGQDVWYYPLYRQMVKFFFSLNMLIFMDPIIPGQDTWYYPIYRQVVKFLTSLSMLIFMVCLVFIAVASVILYRVIIDVDYCVAIGSIGCLLAGTIASSVLNAVAILILGQLYDRLAVKLTNWENHRTQTQYDDALIIKLFAFQFANSYASLFYIAFFRGMKYENGIFGMGDSYQDTCGEDNNCMAMLSFQVLTLMLMKPLPKFLKDIIIPAALKIWRKRTFCRKSKVGVNDVSLTQFIEREHLKPDLGDFTLGEYTEKVIVYGFLMLFAASFPLAPLIALLINAFDIRVDAKRMIWWYRRPLSRMAQDIGMWQGILEFLNIAGVISNAFLLAFTSGWGRQYDLSGKLFIVIGFEHIVFAFKFFIGWVVPNKPREVILAQRRHLVFFFKFIIAAFVSDVPAEIRLGTRREKYQVAKIMNRASERDINKVNTGADADALREKFQEVDERAQEEYEMSLRRRKKKKSRRDGEYDESDLEEHGKKHKKRGSLLRKMANQSESGSQGYENPSLYPQLPKLEPLRVPNEPWNNVWGRPIGNGMNGEDTVDYHKKVLPDIVERPAPSEKEIYTVVPQDEDVGPPPQPHKPYTTHPKYEEDSV